MNMIGVLANAPKMLWTDCPDDSSCNRCLDIAFESENDIACLHQKYPENSCVFEGALMNGNSMIVVSSDECFEHDTLENIQVFTSILGFKKISQAHLDPHKYSINTLHLIMK